MTIISIEYIKDWSPKTTPLGQTGESLVEGILITWSDNSTTFFPRPYKVFLKDGVFTISGGCECKTFKVSDTPYTVDQLKNILDSNQLPIASATILGGVKIGGGLEVGDETTLGKVTWYAPYTVLTVDPISGQDNYPIASYPTSPFRTLTAAIKYINNSPSRNFTINIVNSTLADPAVFNLHISQYRLTAKSINFAGGFIRFDSRLLTYNCYLLFENTIITKNVIAMIIGLNSGTAMFNSCTINCNNNTGPYAGLFSIYGNGSVCLGGNTTVNFGADNSYLFFTPDRKGVHKLCLLDRSNIVFNTGAFIGNLINTSYDGGVVDIYIGNLASVNWGNLPLTNTRIVRNNGQSIGGYASTDTNYSEALYSAKPMFTPNMQTYNDNASALAGGAVVGEFYKTATGEVRVVV